MKKLLVVAMVALSVLSCEKNTESKEFKTAYVDTNKLLDEYTAAKDIEAKYKAKSVEMGKELEAEVSKFKIEASNFQKNAQANGQTWAQQKGAELQKREQQLGYAQQAMMQQLQQDLGTELDTLISGVRKFIKNYGKEKGYSYIYGTGEAATVLYAEDKYDITGELVKLLNDKYKSEGKKEDVPADSAEKK